MKELDPLEETELNLGIIAEAYRVLAEEQRRKYGGDLTRRIGTREARVRDYIAGDRDTVRLVDLADARDKIKKRPDKSSETGAVLADAIDRWEDSQ